MLLKSEGFSSQGVKREAVFLYRKPAWNKNQRQKNHLWMEAC